MIGFISANKWFLADAVCELYFTVAFTIFVFCFNNATLYFGNFQPLKIPEVVGLQDTRK
jgi:hypothetical protein